MGMGYARAWAFAGRLAQRYGRPVVTGIGLAEQQDGAGQGTGVWYVRIDLHSAESGDAHLVLWDGSDQEEQILQAFLSLFLELNKLATIRDMERMEAAARDRDAAIAEPERS